MPNVNYNVTFKSGEITLEANSLARLLLKSIDSNNNKFNQNNFCQEYIELMASPGSHHDTFAFSCHMTLHYGTFF